MVELCVKKCILREFSKNFTESRLQGTFKKIYNFREKADEKRFLVEFYEEVILYMQKKRILSILLSVCLAIGCAGCSQQGSTAASNETAFATADEGAVEIAFWHSFSSGSNLEAIEKIISDFNEVYEGQYKVVGTYQGGYADILSKLSVGFAAGECPVVSFIDSVDTPQLIVNDMVLNLSEYAAEKDPEFDFGQYIPGLMNYGTGADGNYYALPCGRSTPLMYVNLDIVKEATGTQEIPKTRAELVTLLEAVRDNTDATPFMCDMVCWYFANFLTSAGGHFLSADGESDYFAVDDAALNAFSFWENLADEGLYKAAGVDGLSAWEQFVNGDVAVLYQSTGTMTNIYNNAQFEVAVDYLVADKCYSVATGGNNLILMNTASEEELAGGWEFIKYATSLEVNAYINEKTGYMLNNINSGSLESVQKLWEEKPQYKVAYDQLEYVDDQYVSPYFASLNQEIVALLTQMLQDGSLSAEEATEQLLLICEELLPGGNAETYP
ncbi:MAG: extracellular solute-binding protein [Clostridiales bacterium]|nr:extracellular solute-binding protein [Clostridiales bacterium]